MRIAILSAMFFVVPAFAAGFPPRAPELEALNVQTGHWIYHGTTAPGKKGGKPGTFIWDEHCGWSSNQLFLMCSFDNDWSGNKIQSLVMDTWNTSDKSYWHYEMYAVGASGANPWAVKMTIRGNTWIELGENHDHGKKSYERIRYVYTSPSRVRVTIQESPDDQHWKTTLAGTGVKNP